MAASGAAALQGLKLKVLHKTPSSVVVYWQHFLSASRQQRLLSALSAELPWRREVDDFGVQDRESVYMGVQHAGAFAHCQKLAPVLLIMAHAKDDTSCVFSYVGLTLKPRAWHPECLAIKEELNQVAAPLVSNALTLSQDHCKVTACLLNHYPENDGEIPWHWDEVRAHGNSKIVASVSLGGPRRFELKPRMGGDSEEPENAASTHVISQTLEPGSVLLMAGSAQEELLHRLPLDLDKSGQAQERIALTLRSIVPGFEEMHSASQAEQVNVR